MWKVADCNKLSETRPISETVSNKAQLSRETAPQERDELVTTSNHISKVSKDDTPLTTIDISSALNNCNVKYM